jgi:hypothetical protein
MKSEDASMLLRRFTESAATLPPWAIPQEHFYEDFVLLVLAPKNGWSTGFRVDFTTKAWSIAEVISMPAGQEKILPMFDAQETWNYLETAVLRARGRRRAMAEQLTNLTRNADFIEARFKSWRDKGAPRTSVEYAALAAKYADEVRAGNSRATATLAERVGMSPAVMAQRIKEARRRLLLTRGEQGRASGVLTPLGVLYVDPQFPGMSALRQQGMKIREIGDKYGISDRVVWAAIGDERTEGGSAEPSQEFMSYPDQEQ